jgi:invasion protein IalB
MDLRRIASVALLPLLLTLSPAVAADAPAAAPPPADPNAPPAPQFSVNQPFGDWAVRCALETVKSPAPCDVIQLTVNQDTKQRIMSFSLAFVPSRDSYALQLIVPIGVALSKGVTVASGDRPLENIKYNRCERDGCYVELLVDTPTVAALQAMGGTGKSTNVTVYSYGQFKELPLPVSLNGFPEAMERMKTLARQRAVALPASTQTPPPASGTPAPGAARAAAPAAPARPAAAPATPARPAAAAPARGAAPGR